jgi:hypothetical protein
MLTSKISLKKESLRLNRHLSSCVECFGLPPSLAARRCPEAGRLYELEKQSKFKLSTGVNRPKPGSIQSRSRD